jgi:hypothetical protein
MAVTNCNIDMEALISDSNRSIATLAITTLLKTGARGCVRAVWGGGCGAASGRGGGGGCAHGTTRTAPGPTSKPLPN